MPFQPQKIRIGEATICIIWTLLVGALNACSDPVTIGLSDPTEPSQEPCQPGEDPATICTTPFPELLLVADFSSDGIDDLIVFGKSTQIDVYRRFNKGEPEHVRLYSGAEYLDQLSQVLLCDVNSDGATDVLFSERQGTNSMVWIQEGSTLASTNISSPQYFAAPLNCIDGNGDGYPDLVGRSLKDTLRMRTGNGDGSFDEIEAFAPGFSFGPGSEPRLLEVNGDDILDIVSIEFELAQVSIYAGGDAGFSAPEVIAISSMDTITSYTITDVDEDGITDILVMGSHSCVEECTPGRLAFLQGTGISFLMEESWDLPLVPNSAALGDLTGDVRLELIVAAFPDDKLLVLSEIFSDQITISEFRLDAVATDFAISDLDGDSNSEITAVHPELDLVKMYTPMR